VLFLILKTKTKVLVLRIWCCLYDWCRRQQQDEMIERDVMQWLVKLLRNCDALSDYMLEYAVALLMNLCLRTAGQPTAFVRTAFY